MRMTSLDKMMVLQRKTRSRKKKKIQLTKSIMIREIYLAEGDVGGAEICSVRTGSKVDVVVFAGRVLNPMWNGYEFLFATNHV
ncbi:hypothetical protein QZH41_020130, partial [Actinostola sp. cb2023]